MTTHNDGYVVYNCPACGQPDDGCIGHTMTGDPLGYSVLTRHDSDDHSLCHANAPCTQLRISHAVKTAIVVFVLLLAACVLAPHDQAQQPSHLPHAWEIPHA